MVRVGMGWDMMQGFGMRRLVVRSRMVGIYMVRVRFRRQTSSDGIRWRTNGSSRFT